MNATVSKIRKAVAEKLKLLRHDWGLKREQMAARLGVTTNSYYKNEQAQTLPGVPTMNRLANDYDISMDWFLCDKGPRDFKNKSKLEALEQEMEKTKQAIKKAGQERDKAVADYRASMKTGVTDILDEIQKDQRFYIKIMTVYQDYKDGKTKA